jgi:hypothetical protein
MKIFPDVEIMAKTAKQGSTAHTENRRAKVDVGQIYGMEAARSNSDKISCQN